LDPMSASTRMNRYEVGARKPDPELAERLGKVLGVPSCYFYAAEDDVAKLLLTYGQLKRVDRSKVLESAERLSVKQVPK